MEQSENKKTRFLIIPFIAILFSFSCQSYIRNLVQKELRNNGVSDYIFIGASARVGDYAYYCIGAGLKKTNWTRELLLSRFEKGNCLKYEIIKQINDEFLIESIMPNILKIVYRVDRNGKVLKAENLVESREGIIREELRIKAYNSNKMELDRNSIDARYQYLMEKNSSIQTLKGSITGDPIYYFRNDPGFADQYQLDYHNKDLTFTLVKTSVYYVGHPDPEEVISQILVDYGNSND